MAKTASNNGRKNTSQSRKTNTQGKKTTAQGRKKQTKKNVQTQADWEEELNGLCLAYLELWNTYFL